MMLSGIRSQEYWPSPVPRAASGKIYSSCRAEPKVCRLSAGGRRIRTIGPALCEKGLVAPPPAVGSRQSAYVRRQRPVCSYRSGAPSSTGIAANRPARRPGTPRGCARWRITDPRRSCRTPLRGGLSAGVVRFSLGDHRAGAVDESHAGPAVIIAPFGAGALFLTVRRPDKRPATSRISRDRAALGLALKNVPAVRVKYSAR